MTRPIAGLGLPRSSTGTSLYDLDVTMVGQPRPDVLQRRPTTRRTTAAGSCSDGRLVTTDVGDQQPLAAANGQLIVWFPDAGRLHRLGHRPTARSTSPSRPRAASTSTRKTASTSPPTGRGSRPTSTSVACTATRTSPTSMAQCTRTDATGAPLVDDGPHAEVSLHHGHPLGALTPSAIVGAPGGGFYVSSVLTGVIAEYSATGRFVRRILDPPLVNPLPARTRRHAVRDGRRRGGLALVRRHRRRADAARHRARRPQRFGATHPLRRRRAAVPGDHRERARLPRRARPRAAGGRTGADAHRSRRPAREWPCGSWGMYGANVGRTFSTECPTSINTVTARTLVPGVDRADAPHRDGVPRGGRRHRLRRRLERHDVRAPRSRRRRALAVPDGATRRGGVRPDRLVARRSPTSSVSGATTKRLVVFGAGPRLYALDAAERPRGLGARPVDGPAGDAHGVRVVARPSTTGSCTSASTRTTSPRRDTGGVRGGLLAIDAATGALLWEFNPELGQAGVGCGERVVVADDRPGRAQRAARHRQLPGRPADGSRGRRTPRRVTALDLNDGERGLDVPAAPAEPGRPRLRGDAERDQLPGAARVWSASATRTPCTTRLDPAHRRARSGPTRSPSPGNLQEDFAVGGFIGSTRDVARRRVRRHRPRRPALVPLAERCDGSADGAGSPSRPTRHRPSSTAWCSPAT